MSDLTPVAADAARVVVGLGAVVVLPLGVRLLGAPAVARAESVLWPVVGALAAAGLWLPVGAPAALLAAPFAAATVVLATGALRVQAAVTAVALVTPLIGAVALLCERAGWGLLGFGGDYLALTVPHMLFAGFGACVATGLVARAAPSAAARVAAVSVPAGVLLVLVGYLVGDVAELVGAVVLALGLWCAAAASVRLDGPRTARVLLWVGAATVALSMVLALWWALGEATDVVHPGLSTMALTHGVANALGFVLCTVLGLRLLVRPTERVGLTYAEVGATLAGDLPAGYRALRVRYLVAPGSVPADAERLGDALLRWQVHAAAGVDVRPDADAAAPGVRLVSRPGVGPVHLSVPCEVVWTQRTPACAGFAYGTLPGHPFRGEEAFTVERDAAGDLWFVVSAFSAPALWWVRLAGPATVLGQRLYLGRLARGARRVHAAGNLAVGSRS